MRSLLLFLFLLCSSVVRAATPTDFTYQISPANPKAGDALIVTVTVTAPATSFPARAYFVVAINGADFPFSAEVVNRTAQIQVTPLPSGTYQAAIQLAPLSEDFAHSVKQFPLQVAEASPSLSTPSISSEPRLGAAVSIQTEIRPQVSGSVTFFDGNRALGTVPTVAVGLHSIAVIGWTADEVGSHQIRASFAGQPGYLPASSPVLDVIVRGVPGLSIDVPLPKVDNAAPVIVDVRASGPGVTPSGRVRLFEGTAEIAAGELDSGGALRFRLAAGTLKPGLHSLHATYEGDRFWDAVTSRIVTQEITAAAAPTQIRLSLNLQGGVQVKALVTGGQGVPSGQVTFRDLKTDVSYPATLSGGEATVTNAALAGHFVEAVYTGDATHAASTSSKLLVLQVVNGFSYAWMDLAAEEIVSVFGEAFTGGVEVGPTPLVTTLAGVTIDVTDKNGLKKPASLYFVSPTQMTLVTPAGLASGVGELVFRTSAGETHSATVNLAATAPGLATANADGAGAPAAQLLRVKSDGSVWTESPASFNTPANKFQPSALRFGGDELYLVLYGTGFRGASPVTCSAGAMALSVLFGGAQGTFAGLDQINLKLPAALSGRGTVEVTCSAGAVASNPVTLSFVE